MAVGVFGLLGADETIYAQDEDCYSSFYALSSVMGHLTVADANGPRHGLWGMNDAGGPWLGADPAGRRAEFQVAPNIGRTAALPLEAFTWTALACVERFGPFDLQGLEYYLPLELARPDPSDVQSGKGWFSDVSDDRRCRLRITIDSGESPAATEHAEEIVRALDRVSPYEEAVEPSLASGTELVDFADPVPWRWWLGDGTPHVATLQATAAGWDGLGVGRVVRLLAEACLSIGIVGAIGVRVVRGDVRSPRLGHDGG